MELQGLPALGLGVGSLLVAMRLARTRTQKEKDTAPSLLSILGAIKKGTKNAGFSDEAYAQGCRWVPRSSDVIVCTAPKTGTTWLQWIVCLLRNDGVPPACDDIYQIAPWIHMCHDLDIDVDGEQPSFPRVFKSHQPLSCINRGARYIVTVRKPESTAVSWYNFLKAKQAPPATSNSLSGFIRLKEFMVDDMRFGTNLWGYYREYWHCREADNVLVLVFEDLVKDLRSHLAVIAEFVGVEADEKLLDAVAAAASKQEMLKPEVTRKLDESWTHKVATRIGRSPEPESWMPTSRVTNGHKDKLTEDDLAFLRELWRKNLEETIGIKSYEELAAGVRATLHKRYPHCFCEKVRAQTSWIGGN